MTTNYITLRNEQHRSSLFPASFSIIVNLTVKGRKGVNKDASTPARFIVNVTRLSDQTATMAVEQAVLAQLTPLVSMMAVDFDIEWQPAYYVDDHLKDIENKLLSMGTTQTMSRWVYNALEPYVKTPTPEYWFEHLV